MSWFPEKFMTCQECGRPQEGLNCTEACFEEGICGSMEECRKHLRVFPEKGVSKGLCPNCQEKYDKIRENNRFRSCPLEYGCPLKVSFCSEERFRVCSERGHVQSGFGTQDSRLKVRKKPVGIAA